MGWYAQKHLTKSNAPKECVVPPHTLTNEFFEIVVDPAQGVNILAGYLKKSEQLLAFMPDSRAADCDLNASSFVLAPYSNRIENGHFTFQGQEYQLDNAARHASHGDVRGRAWQVEEQSATKIVCSIDARTIPDINWPWPFAATLTYQLQGREFSSELTVTNLGETAMPAGLGWHPYYSRALTRQGEPVYLQFNVESVYPDANDNRIPSGPPVPLAPNQDFHTERELTPENFVDACFYGYDGGGSIAWPESDVRLRYHASEACGHFIVYNPAKPYFAVEPVTNANNGVNLLAAGDPTSGIQVLAPNETLAATFGVEVVA